VATAWLFDDRSRRLLLAEAMHAFAAYLRAKAALYNPDAEGPAGFRALIDAHATLADRLQAARDSLFARRQHRMQLKRIDTLVALLDAFETVLSSDADYEALRGAPQRELLWRLNNFVLQMAEEVERLTLALRCRARCRSDDPRAFRVGRRTRVGCGYLITDWDSRRLEPADSHRRKPRRCSRAWIERLARCLAAPCRSRCRSPRPSPRRSSTHWSLSLSMHRSAAW
jgi:uncharacterized membrane protein YccC